MARIRTIKPSAFTSEKLARCSLEAERTFFGLLTQVDDDGRLKYQPAVLNGALWPERIDSHPSSAMESDFDELVRERLVCRYTDSAGRKLFHIPNFNKHQRINRPSKSTFEPCPEDHRSGEGDVEGTPALIPLPAANE